MSDSHRPHPPAMRLILLALAVTLTAGYSTKPVVQLSQGKTYHYRYEVVSAVRRDQDLPLAKVGIKIESDVLLSTSSNTSVILTFHNTSIYESNDYSLGNWVRADQLSDQLASEFKRTMKFDFKNGKVDKILVPSKSSLFVENIKKAMINTLQLTIKSEQTLYTLQEVGSQGTCKTTYMLQRPSANNNIKVTKTRNLRDCLKPVIKSSGLSYTESCPECVPTIKAIIGSDSYTYMLHHVNNGYLITWIKSKELINFNPLFEPQGGTIMESEQQLILKEVKDGQILPSPEVYLPASPEYRFSNEDDQFPFWIKDIASAEAQASQLLESLANNNNQSVDPNAPMEFVKLTRLLRASSRDVLDNLWKKYSHLSNHRRVMRDAIPQDQSLKSLKFIKEKFGDGNLTASEAAQMLLVGLQVVDIDRMDGLVVAKSLLEDPKIVENDLVRKVSALGVGSWIHRWCKKRSQCPASVVLDSLHEMLNKAILVSDSKTISLAIRAVGNAAQPSSVRAILKLLPGYGHICGILEPQVIVDAVLALRRFSTVSPKEIQQISLKLLLNRQLQPELRTAAMIALFDTVPSMGLVKNVAIYIKNEPNLQVAHFAYSLIKSLSMSNIPDRVQLAKGCQHALRIIKRPFPRIYRGYLSMAYSRSLYHRSDKIGAAIFAYGIKNKISAIPKTSILRLEGVFSGVRVAPIEVISRINALMESLLKVTDGSVSRAEKMIKIARILSGADPQLLRRLESVISIAPWSQEVFYFDPVRSIAELTARRPARELIKEISREISRGVSWNGFKGLMPLDIYYGMATSFGLPLSVHALTAGLSTLSLDVRGGSPWPLSDDSQAQQSNVSVKVSARLSSKFQSIIAVGLSTGQIQAQLQTHSKLSANIPVAVEVSADMSNMKFGLKVKKIQEKEIASVSTETLALTGTQMDSQNERRPLIPHRHAEELSSVSTSSAEYFSGSSESIVLADMPTKVEKHDSIPPMRKGVHKICDLPGGMLSAFYYTQSTSSNWRCNSCFFCGTHGVSVVIERGDNNVKEVEVKLGLGREANNIMTAFNQIEETETLEDTNVLTNLQKILTPGLKNQTSSSSSSESYSSEDSRSSMSQSSSSSESSSSSTSSEASRQTLQGIYAEHASSMNTDSSEIFNPKYPASESPVMAVGVLVIRERGPMTVVRASLFKTERSVHIVLKKVSGGRHWRMDIFGKRRRQNKITIGVQWGTSGREYQVGIIADSTVMEDKLTDRALIVWKKVPKYLYDISEQITRILSREAPSWGWDFKEATNHAHMLSMYVVHEPDDELSFVCIAPHWSLHILKMELPFSKLIKEAYAEYDAAEGNLGNKMLHVISNANAAKCTLVQDTVVTFNSRQYKSELPHICSQVLAQDCTAERKFLVQLTKDQILNQNSINVLVADIDANIHQRGNAIGVTVNGIEIPVSNLPYQHPTGTIRIAQKDQGIALFAARHGLSEVFLDLNGLQIKIPDWMRGQTCGMCGRGDGEFIEEYHTPNGRLAASALSFAQSWVVPGTGCKDISKCYLATESVKLDKQISLNGQESKCYSVEPVLRCHPGCTPVRTTTIDVGYHCVPAEASVNRAESLSSIFKKSVDVTEKAIAHLACRCNPQCA